MTAKQARILAIIAELGPAHGSPIRGAYEERYERISIGMFHVVLDALEEKRLIECEEEAGGAERGFRIKRVYRVTAAGRAALSEG